MFSFRALRRTILAVCVTLALAIALALVSAASRAQGGPNQPVNRPKGLVAVIANDPNAPLDREPFHNQYVNGIAYQIHWEDIQPGFAFQNPAPDWKRLDEVFDVAKKSHKWVQLLIFPGFFTPAWALQGVEADLFPIQYGPDKHTFAMLPMPWDPVYLRRWYDFLYQVSNRYGDRSEFKMIAAGGPTSVSDEFSLPAHNKIVKMPVLGEGYEYCSDIERWQRHNYTLTQHLDAWRQTFKAYAEIFPKQYISFSLGNGVPINAQGTYDKTGKTNRKTQKGAVDEAVNNLEHQCVLQSSALTGNPHHHAHANDLVIRYNGITVTGFQLGGSCEQNPIFMAGNKFTGGSTPAEALLYSIINGFQPNAQGKVADYLEIHAIDIDTYDPDFQLMMQFAYQLM